jgi:hypothetical protein
MKNDIRPDDLVVKSCKLVNKTYILFKKISDRKLALADIAKAKGLKW